MPWPFTSRHWYCIRCKLALKLHFLMTPSQDSARSLHYHCTRAFVWTRLSFSLIQSSEHCRSESCREQDRGPERGHVGFCMFNVLSFVSTRDVSKTFPIPWLHRKQITLHTSPLPSSLICNSHRGGWPQRQSLNAEEGGLANFSSTSENLTTGPWDFPSGMGIVPLRVEILTLSSEMLRA